MHVAVQLSQIEIDDDAKQILLHVFPRDVVSMQKFLAHAFFVLPIHAIHEELWRETETTVNQP